MKPKEHARDDSHHGPSTQRTEVFDNSTDPVNQREGRINSAFLSTPRALIVHRDILALQRISGNQAVVGMLSANNTIQRIPITAENVQLIIRALNNKIGPGKRLPLDSFKLKEDIKVTLPIKELLGLINGYISDMSPRLSEKDIEDSPSLKDAVELIIGRLNKMNKKSLVKALGRKHQYLLSQ
jgi:hypothetical protein